MQETERICRMVRKMTERELILLKILEKRITQKQAAKDLRLSTRHVRRLLKSYQQHGNKALLSKKFGRVSNRRIPEKIRKEALQRIVAYEFARCSPTYVCRRIYDRYKIKLSRETIRQLMTEAGTWQPNQKKRPAVHQQRERRARVGELVQIDGSPHHWFEDRGEPCSFIGFVDDATGQISGKFFKTETTAAYMEVTIDYIKQHGVPQTFYSDKHAIFRVNKPGCDRRENLTEFGRALKELGIGLICAETPQAKGRIECKNRVLQDWIVPDFRYLKVNNIEDANRHIYALLAEHNQRYEVAPKNPTDAHRKLDPDINLEDILCEKANRKVSKNLEVQYENMVFQLDPHQISSGLYKATVTVIKHLSGKISIEYKSKKLSFRILRRQTANGSIASAKELNYLIDHAINPEVVTEERDFKKEHVILEKVQRVA